MALMGRILFRVVALYLLFVACVHAAVFKGTLKGPDSWKYLARFCFLPTDHQTGGEIKGQIEATFRFPEYSKLTLLEYLERSAPSVVKSGTDRVTSFDAWKDVYSSQHNCSSRMEKGMAFPLYDPDLVSACRNIWFTGREGTNSVINGLWEEYNIPTFGGRRIYAKQNADTWLFIYFMVDAGAWYIAREIGSKLVVAEAMSEAVSPDLIRSSWYVADGQGSFEEDVNMRAACGDIFMDPTIKLTDPSGNVSPEMFDRLMQRPPPPPPMVAPPPNAPGKGNSLMYTLSDIPLQDSMQREAELLFKMVSEIGEETPGFGLIPDAAGMLTTTRIQSFQDDKARWLFLAIANCDQECSREGNDMCQGPLHVEYELTLTNGEGWGVKHFSADEHSILETEIFFFAFQFMLLVGGLYVRSVLTAQQKYHHTVRLLLVSICLTLFADFFDVIHYCKFASDGIGEKSMHMLSIWLTGLSDTCLLLLVVLVAKGWSICCRKLSATGRVKISIYTTTYICMFTAMLLWFDYGMSDAEVVYIYHSVPGYLIVALRCAGTVWMCYATFVTLTKFRMKRRFFKKFLFTFGIWQMSLPLVVALALAIPTWTRAKVVNTMELVFTFCAQLALLLLYYPGRYNRSFPFHATTNDMLPKNPTKWWISKKGNIPDEGGAAEDGDKSKTQSFGNTRIVTGGLSGGRLERAALRSAMELADRVTSDMKSLSGCLEQINDTDDGDEQLESNERLTDLSQVGQSEEMRPSIRSMMASGNTSVGMGSGSLRSMMGSGIGNGRNGVGGHSLGGEGIGGGIGGGIGSNQAGQSNLAAALGPAPGR